MNDDGWTLDLLLTQWPETRHLRGRVRRVEFLKPDGTPDVGVETGELIPVLEEFLVIVEALAQRAPREMREVASKVRKALPTMRAFHADPVNVINSGVN